MFDNLRLPIVSAPMFLVSDPQLVGAVCKSGIVGTVPSINTRQSEDFEQWLIQIEKAKRETIDSGGTFAPYGVNIILDPRGKKRSQLDLMLCKKYRVPLVITSVGDPSSVVSQVHDWGGLVIHDAIALRHAEKAAEAGVDGIILVCAGAGGHGGHLSPFSFVPQVREFYEGKILVGGGIATGEAIQAVLALGGDFAYIGTPFIGTTEAQVDAHYKQLMVQCKSDEIIMTSGLSGMPANFMVPSLIESGMDPTKLPQGRVIDLHELPEGKAPWRDIWSAGHGVGMVKNIPSVEDLVSRLETEFHLPR